MFRPILLATFLLPLPALASDLMVKDAWVPTAPSVSKTHAAYVSLYNLGETPRTLVKVTAPTHKMTHLHESKETDGVSTMSMIHQIEIPAGGMLIMKPGGLHVMLMSAKSKITEGAMVPLTLEFANGEILNIDAEVKPRVPES